MKKSLPDTSIEAYKALQIDALQKMYQRIIRALEVLGMATYEELSDYLNCQDRNQVSRRLKEMEGLELIWKPGLKRQTKRHRNAYCYQLTGKSSPKTEKQLPSELKDSSKSHERSETRQDSVFRQGNIVFLD